MSELCTGNCLGCPEVIKSIGLDESLRQMVNAIEKSAVDERLVTEVAPYILEWLEGTGATAVGPDGENKVESAEDLAKTLRMNAATLIDSLDQRREDNANDVSEITEGCLGPLKMRAKKAGRVITVTVCNSPIAPDGYSSDAVDIYRSWDS